MNIIGEMPDRAGIETRQEYVQRNLALWRDRLPQDEVHGRRGCYEQSLSASRFPRHLSADWLVGEVGAGPWGGILRICAVPVRQRCYIDYMQQELCELGFIDWPQEDIYVTSPAEKIPLSDGQLDALISFNCLDHGWDIRAALSECFRVAKRCYLAFDCRGDNPEEVQKRQGQDKNHWQLLRYEQVREMAAELLPNRPWRLLDAQTNSLFPVALIVVEQ